MTKCQNCGRVCKPIVNLGEQPLCNQNIKSPAEFKNEKKYTLGMVFCSYCYLVQQPIKLPTHILFPKNFNYLSSSSKPVVDHYVSIANSCVDKYDLDEKDLVMDIGSNDGVFLKPLKEKGINVLGIDPAPLAARRAMDKKIPTIINEFEKAKLPDLNGLRIITAFDVLAHTGNIHGFLDKVKKLIDKYSNAIFISQSHYLPSLIEKCEWDTIYHEHQRFYTISSLNNLFKRHGIFIHDCEENSFYGGSILIYASGKKLPISSRLKRKFKTEAKYRRFDAYAEFKSRIERSKVNLIKVLRREKIAGRHIIGIGCPMKSSVLLNYCKIDNTILDFLTEINPLKIDTYSPGMHIKIIDERELFKMDRMPEIALILSWNMAYNIIDNLKKNGFNGKFIIPLPDIKIVE